MKIVYVPYLQKNGKIVQRKMWSDDGFSWYWIGSRKYHV